MLVFNIKRLLLYSIEVCLLVGLFPAVDSIKRDRKKPRESYVMCPHPKCQCKPAKHGDVVVRCIKVSERLPEFTKLNITFAEIHLAKKNLTELPESGFRGVRTRLLDIASNPFHLERINGMAFAGLEDVLETLWLSDCGLHEMPNGSLSILQKLKVLHFEENHMSEIPSRFLFRNRQLREIYLNRNNIKTISVNAFSELNNLKLLKLGQNQIHSLPAKLFKFLTNLTSLDISHNFIHDIAPGTFEGLKNLRWLELESNMIKSLNRDTFKGARNLRNMKVENNQLIIIANNTFRAINKLEYLSIDIANVSTLTASTFGGLGRLKTMSIGEIVHQELPDRLLSSMLNLRRLSLTDNMGKFTGLQKNMFAEKFSFKNLSVFVSPIRGCRCSEQWIRNMTTLGTYVHGFCVDNRPLSCTGKVFSKVGSGTSQKGVNSDRKLKTPESTDT